MSEPLIAARKPFYVELEQGRTCRWCTCGRSRAQPYCDGSHRGTDFRPLPYTAKAHGEEVLFCGCKRTGSPPFCDGSHNNLPGGYQEDDPHSAANRAVPDAATSGGARVMLEGECYVFRTGEAPLQTTGNARWCLVIGEALGARYQSQFYVEVDQGESPPMAFGDRHGVLFIAEGRGTVRIGTREFAVEATDGVHVRPGEHAQLVPSRPMRVYVSACPAAPAIEWPAALSPAFDEAYPQRVVGVDPAKRHAMAARFFQMLVDKTIGSTVATQFIGHIPQSKAEPHRHLYEEALILLSGQGTLWTPTGKTTVRPGDVMFLPRKQTHSLQCTSADGMDVVGLIYPGDNPSINY